LHAGQPIKPNQKPGSRKTQNCETNSLADSKTPHITREMAANGSSSEYKQPITTADPQEVVVLFVDRRPRVLDRLLFANFS
jgi:hypothetical protein